MINNVLQFVIDPMGNIINSDESSLKALSNLTSRIQVVSSFSDSVSISVNYMVYDSTNRRLKQYMIPVNKYGRDVIPTSSPLYNDIQDWNVYEIDINDRILSYISKHRAGKIGISFGITQSTASSMIKRLRGRVGLNKPFPTDDLLDGDGVIVDDYNFGYEGNLYNRGDYLYYNATSETWIRTKHTSLAITSTRDIAVDPSITYEDGEFDENLLSEFLEGFNDTILNKQDKHDSSLLTLDKSISGAINELKVEIDEKDLTDYYTKPEIDAMDAPSNNVEYVRKNKGWTRASILYPTNPNNESVIQAGYRIRNIAPVMQPNNLQTDFKQDSGEIYLKSYNRYNGANKVGNIELRPYYPGGPDVVIGQGSLDTNTKSQILVTDSRVRITTEKGTDLGTYIFNAQDITNEDNVMRRKDLGFKLDKIQTVTDKDQVYVKLSDGGQTLININDVNGLVKYINSRITSGLPLVDNHVANKEYVDTLVHNAVLPDHYKGQISDISLLPETSTNNGDFYYILDLGSEYNNLAGNATWNGNDNKWDIAPDKVFNPDYTTIGLDSLGRLTILKLPNKLTIEGIEFDGSEAKTINILPSKPVDEFDKLLGWDGDGNLTWKSAVLEHDQLTGLNDDVDYQHITLSEKETLEFTTNKTTNVNILSTHDQYPTAKAVYEALGTVILDVSFEEGV